MGDYNNISLQIFRKQRYRHKKQGIQRRAMEYRRTTLFKNITVAGNNTSCELDITIIACTEIFTEAGNRRDNKKNNPTKENTQKKR
ncbi:MAG: hypothetical protein WCE45_10225 [Sedimentisphaerales bacterium]